MPIYEYRCTSCGHLEEVFAAMSDPPPAHCSACGVADPERVLHPVSVHYKGSGFYATDYGSKKSKRSSDGGAGSDGDAGSGAGGSDTSASSTSSPDSSGSSSTSSSSSGSGES